MIVTTPEEREALIEGGRRLGNILAALEKAVAPGVTTHSLDALAEKLIRDGGDTPAFKGYRPDGAHYPFPATLCVSVNDEIVHGIPGDRVLNEGDILALDLGLVHKGMVLDAAITTSVGETDAASRKVMEATKLALARGIEAARPGNRIGDISYAIGQTLAKAGVSVVKVLGGHGVGQSVHEEPWIANEGYPGTGPEIVPGMVLALEPIANAGKASVILSNDGYTYRSRDGSRSAHFEHSILIEEDTTTILTERSS